MDRGALVRHGKRLARAVREHRAASAEAARQRRAVMLALHEQHGFTYDRLSTTFGMNRSRTAREVALARHERSHDASGH